MSIKGGQILHDVRGFVIDRIQTGGVSALNIPEEKIYETGNFQTVAIVRDIPDITFGLDSLDVSTETEALIVGKDPTTITTGQAIDLSQSIPFDVISPFKAARNVYSIVKGIVVPYLSLDSVTYRFGVGANSAQQFSLRGDAVYYVPGQPYSEVKNITPGINQTYTFANTAIAYTEVGVTQFALSVCAKNPTTGVYKRLFRGADYTDTSAAVTTLADLSGQGYTQLHVSYGSTTLGSYPQTVHQGVSVKPAAVRGKDIAVYVSDGAATPTLLKWTGVQTFEATRSVNLQADTEFDNRRNVAYDYDVPEVRGTISVKSFDVNDLFAKIAQVSNVTTSVVAGPFSSAPLEVLVKIRHPDTGVTLKSIDIPDARFTLPNVEARANTKLEVPFAFQSDGGQITVYRGDKPGT